MDLNAMFIVVDLMAHGGCMICKSCFFQQFSNNEWNHETVWAKWNWCVEENMGKKYQFRSEEGL